MAKKYKHIELPLSLVGGEVAHDVHRGGMNIQNIPTIPDLPAHKNRLRDDTLRLGSFAEEKDPRLQSDKDAIDLKIKFRGSTLEKMVTKYRLSVYEKYDVREKNQDYANDVIYASVSNAKLPSQNHSLFEQLCLDIDSYVTQNKQRSYFNFVDEIIPLDTEALVNEKLLQEVNQNPRKKFLVDVNFGNSQEASAQKLADIKSVIGDDFLLEVNTEKVHYCRIRATKSSINAIITAYSGVLSVDGAPLITFTSESTTPVDEYQTQNEAENSRPILVVDTAINGEHPLLKDVALPQLGTAEGDKTHGTQTASLVVCGAKISASRTTVLENKVLPVNAFITTQEGVTINEPLIQSALSDNFSADHVMLMSFSINQYQIGYTRKPIDKLSILFDEWAVKYNCIIVSSVGNLFNHWPDNLKELYFTTGYPNYFDLPFSCILPPSDSINNVSVGSITYQAGPDSITPVKEPSPITRRGFVGDKQNNFIKPDFVHYDSNFNKDFDCEYNGPFMAAADGGLTRAPGTSFATPLVTHALGVLSKAYPTYSANTLKALLIHFAEPIIVSSTIGNDELLKSLVGHGIPDLERALHSLNTASCIVIQDEIKVGKKKIVKIPIPASIAGSRSKRLRLRKTIVYNPAVNPKDITHYNPAIISARILRSDDRPMDNATSMHARDGAHKRSNVKTYESVERNTLDFMGTFWSLEVMAEHSDSRDTTEIVQPYSVIVTIEDMAQDDDVDIHEEISQMIELEVGTSIEIDA